MFQTNEPNILNDLHTVIGLKDVRISYSISVHQDIHQDMGWNGPSIHSYMGHPDTDLHLELIVNQMSMTDKKDLFQKIEERLFLMAQNSEAIFVQRQVSPFREEPVYKIDYKFKLKDHDSFITKLHEYALTQMDIEFREALEDELTK